LNILDLLQADGLDVRRVASTNGGEYAGPCPFCGGNDRFCVWPEQGDNGRYWCRQCGQRGDAIQYLRDQRKMSFQEACQYVGKEINSFAPSLSSKRKGANDRGTRSPWPARETTPQSDLWQERAQRLVEESERCLFQPYSFAQTMLGWLKERRGLSEETIKKHRLGLVPIDRWEGHEQWGLDPVLKADGTPKKIWIPRGLTIPLCLDGKILRIRIRRSKMDLKSGDDRRYQTVRGSDSKAMMLEPHREIQVVVESDLDAMFVVQEAQGLVGAVSLGTAGKTPDEEALMVLRRSRLILVALDSDDAGAKAAWRWWPNNFSQARRWPPIAGKDPGDMHLAGVNVRDWIMAGVEEYEPEIQGTEHGEAPSDFAPASDPIQMQSVDGALHPEEARATTSSRDSGITPMDSISPITPASELAYGKHELGEQIAPKPPWEKDEGIWAIHELALMGFRAWAVDNNIRVAFAGAGDPDPDVVTPLLDLVKQNKGEVLFFLKCCCPRCGGVAFVPGPEGANLCLSREWDYLSTIYPGLREKTLKK
jgi:DNA primase